MWPNNSMMGYVMSTIADKYGWLWNHLYIPLVQLVLYYRVVLREDLWGLSLDEANESLATEVKVVKFNFIPLTIKFDLLYKPLIH